MRFIIHWLTLALGLYLVAQITPLGITYDRPHSLAGAALVLIILNTFIRPILVLITLPLVLLSLGFFLLIINAIFIDLLPHFVHGFHVPSFTSAFFASILLSLITWFFTGWDKKARIVVKRRRPADTSSGKVIDI